MIKRRQGKTLIFNCTVRDKQYGDEIDISDEDIKVELTLPSKEIIELPYTIKTNEKSNITSIIRIVIQGNEINDLGVYGITIYFNKNEEWQNIVDDDKFFELVKHSRMER